MKHSILSLLLICLSLPLLAENEKYSLSEQKDMQIRLNHAQKMVQQKKYLQAMDSATYALSLYPDNYSLCNFVRKYWDHAIEESQYRLDTLSDYRSIEHARQRVGIFQHLVNINDNLNTLSLPLHGRNNSWEWQPDIQYWVGHLDHEEKHLLYLEQEEEKRLKYEEELRLKAAAADKSTEEDNL